MLGKLLKYEFKSTMRTFLPMYLVLLSFALLSRFSVAGLSNMAVSENHFLNVLCVLIIVSYVVIIFSLMIVTFIVIVQRFYKNLTGDEGYLMHTLPVSTHSLIQAKVISGVVWSTISVCVICLSLFVLLFQPWFVIELVGEWPEIMEVWGLITAEIGGLRLFAFILELIISMLVGAMSSILMIYASIAIGHTFKKHRIMGSAAAYIGLMMVCQVIAGFTGVAISIPAAVGFETSFDSAAIMNYLLGSIGIGIIVGIGFCVAWYFVTHYVLTSQLNLE